MSQPVQSPAALAPGSIVAVAGASARAAAAWLRRAGLVPICADAFCDRDLKAIALRAAACPPHDFPNALPETLASLDVPDGTPLLLTGAMENHLDVVRKLAAKYPLLTCGPDAIEKVRDPLLGKSMPKIAGVEWPETRQGPIERFAPRAGAKWLLKPRRSAGGRGIRLIKRGEAIDERHVVQRLVEGMSISFVFLVPIAGASKGIAIPFGETFQLIGHQDFGACQFGYAGNAGPADLDDAVIDTMQDVAQVLVERHGLNGIFGIDCIVRDDNTVHPVEVNPRYPASIELLEAASGISAISLLCARQGSFVPSTNRWHAKAIIFAKADCRARDLYEIFAHEAVADVPEVNAEIKKGHPICTVFAPAQNAAQCMPQLQAMADDVYTRGVS